MKRILLLIGCVTLIGLHKIAAQLVYTEPTFPTENDKVTIYYDATQGTAGLKDCNCDVYIHTGVVTSAGSGWRYVKMQWGVANDAWKMTKVSNNLYKYELSPDVRTYYGVPAGESVRQLAMVFRNANGSAEGKADGGKDIFYDLVQAGVFEAALISPAPNSTILKKIGETIDIKAESSQNATLTLKDNGTVIKQVANAKTITHTITVATGSDDHLVEFTADYNGNSLTESFHYIITQNVVKQNPPSGLKLGANQNGNSISLLLNAKDKQNVFVIGAFSDWKIKPEYLMKNSLDGTQWWIELNDLPQGEFTYQYVVDGALRIADPHSEVILDENNDKSIPASAYPNLPAYPSGKTAGFVSLLQVPKKTFNWQATNFQRPAKTDLVIYELLIRDFSTQRNMQFVLDTLNYLKRLGVNAVQFMPINEFDGNQSWGYNPTLHHALDKYYGSPEIFKTLVDECHKAGIAVILDVVFNHVSEKGPIAQLYPIANSPYVNAIAKHPFNVFLDLNHESDFTRAYVDRCLQHWLEEYHIDGFRFDLSKGFTQTNSGSDVGKWSQYDASRIAILKHYTDVIQNTSAGAYPIMEHFAEFKEEREMTDYGMMVWQNFNYAFGQNIMGFSNNSLNNTFYLKNGFQYPHAVTYAESHDEERNMYRAINFGNSNASYNTKDLTTALRRSEAAATMLLTVPGPKMIWQFGELGYDYSINDCGNGTINNNCRLSIKPTRWDYLDNPDRSRLFDVYRSLIDLKKTNPIFKTTDVAMYTGGLSKQIIFNGSDMKMVVFANFDLTEQTIYTDYPALGTYYDFFTGDSIKVTAADQNIQLKAGEYHIYTTKKLPKPIGGYKYFTNNKDVFDEVVTTKISPNPSFVGEDAILSFELLTKQKITIDITDLSGRVITQIAKQDLEAGFYQYNLPETLAAGTYIVRINAGKSIKAQRYVKL